VTDYEARRDAVFNWLAVREFSGYDPYDGLESLVFQKSPLARSAVLRLAWCQLFKRSPINLRRLARVPRSRNPKALGLVLSGIARHSGRALTAEWVPRIVAWLAETADPDTGAWGYPFAWQNRAFYAPRGTPNAVCSAFVVNGLLDAREVLGDDAAADLAFAAMPFFTERLNRVETPQGVCFSYTPADRSVIHNVNLLVAAVLARAGRMLDDARTVEVAVEATRHSLSHQRPDGSWPYGEAPHQLWIDSFHTGFNLGALRRLEDVFPDETCRRARERGYEYFLKVLLDADGLPKYYDRTRYPIDAHCCAQAIITLMEAADIDSEAVRRARRVADWTEATLGRGDGTYSYQRGRIFHHSVVYARWSQAWMYRALCDLSRTTDRVAGGPPPQ
jgi:hypothetical protein